LTLGCLIAEGYGHLMPGSRDDVRERMDAYLDQAEREGTRA